MNVSSMVNDLQVLGVGEDQAKVYFHLLQMGPTKASNLLPCMDTSRSKLYRLLDDLVEAGFASKSSDRPIVFAPLDPEEAFELGQSKLRWRMERLETIRGRQVDRLRSLMAKQDDIEKPSSWKRIEGMASIYRFLQTKMETARSSIEIASNEPTCFATDLPMVEEIWQASFQRAADAGLDYKLLLDFPGDPREQIPDCVGAPEAATFRSFKADRTLHFALLDRSDLLMWTQPSANRWNGTPKYRDQVAIWTSAPGAVAAHELLFDSLWEAGEPVHLNRSSEKR